MRTILICLLFVGASWPLRVLGENRATVPAYDPPFIISYWVGPPMEEATIERYREIADCGFNVVLTPLMPTGGPSETDNKKILDLCRSVGLKAIVQDSRVLALKSDEPGFAKNLDAVVANYTRHPALAGYLLRDEPSADDFSELGALTQGLLQRDPGRLPFVNLLPTYAANTQLGTDSYEEYVRRYIKTVKPLQVGWDHYALMRNGERPGYLGNLEIVSRLCRDARLPFVQTILSVPHAGYRDPSEADLRWQVYNSLCYGAKGILYFTYWTQPSHGFYHDAIINEKGQRSEKYAVIRELNRRMKVLAPTLLKLQGLRVAHAEPVPQGCLGLDEHFPATAVEGGPLALGWLRDDERHDYLFVVNRSFTGPSKSVSVLFHKKIHQVVEVSQKSGRPVEAAFDPPTRRLKTLLQAGEGRLFRFDGG